MTHWTRSGPGKLLTAACNLPRPHLHRKKTLYANALELEAVLVCWNLTDHQVSLPCSLQLCLCCAICSNLLHTEQIHKNCAAGCWYLILFSCTSSLGETGVRKVFLHVLECLQERWAELGTVSATSCGHKELAFSCVSRNKVASAAPV